MHWSILLMVLVVCTVVTESKKRFDNYKVYRIEPKTLQQFKFLQNFTAYASEEEVRQLIHFHKVYLHYMKALKPIFESVKKKTDFDCILTK